MQRLEVSSIQLPLAGTCTEGPLGKHNAASQGAHAQHILSPDWTASAQQQGLQSTAAAADPRLRLGHQQAATASPKPDSGDQIQEADLHSYSTKAAVLDQTEPTAEAAVESPTCVVLPIWRTPKSSVWAEVQEIALKAIATLTSVLDCLLSAKPEEGRWQRYLDLSISLVQLLHDLLIGHLWDGATNCRKILLAGLGPVLKSIQHQVDQASGVSLLAVAMMHRLAFDVNVLASMGTRQNASGWLAELCAAMQHVWMLHGGYIMAYKQIFINISAMSMMHNAVVNKLVHVRWGDAS